MHPAWTFALFPPSGPCDYCCRECGSTDICSSPCSPSLCRGVLACLFFLLAWSWKSPELCGISPFTLHPRKVQCRQRSDLPRSDLTGGRARPRASSLCPARPILSACLLLWPKPQAWRGGCWPNPLPTHSLRFATHSLRFATHRAASPALGPTSLWKLESVSPQQKTVVSGLPFPPGGS